MYSRQQHPRGSRLSSASIESEDERLARRLQEEEERSLNQMSNHSTMSSSHRSSQERDDMMLARQMQEMDSYHQQQQNTSGMSGSNNSNKMRRSQMVACGFDGGHRDLGGHSRDPSGSYSGYASAGSAGHNNISAGRSTSGGSNSNGGDREERLAYARRLQEEAFQRVQAAAKPKSTEESDLELAMKMQIEEGGGDPSLRDQEDEDLKLAMFMEQSGVSIRELDADGLAAAKDHSSGSTLSGGAGSRGGSASSFGLGGGPGKAGNSGGLLGGLYGNRRDDSDDDDSLELGFDGDRKMPAGVPMTIPAIGGRPKQAPSGIPASIPSAAVVPSSIPAMASIPAAITPAAAAKPAPIPNLVVPAAIPHASIPPGVPASIPAAIPPASSNRKQPPQVPLSPMASIALPGGRNASIRLSPSRENFQRQPPKATKSSGANARGSSTGLSRMLPAASKSFGTPRAGSRSKGDLRESRKTPGHTQSANNLMAMRNATFGGSPKSNDRSTSPTRRRIRGHRRGKSGDVNLAIPMSLGDLPPGVNMATANDPLALSFGGGEVAPNSTPVKKKKGKLMSRIFGGKKGSSEGKQNVAASGIPDAIPAAIPGPPDGMESGPLPHSVSASRNINQNSLRTSMSSQEKKQKEAAACSVCGGRSGKMLVAMDRKFHVDCFRCMSCNEVIDPSSVFAVSVDPMGEQQPLHRKCYAEFYGVQCAVCKRAIPANDDGSVSFIKHPFFNTEQMCPCHADEVGRRRCTGCHRFEPEDEPFADLNDGDRCVCYACCRTVIMNNVDVKPLWQEVLRFFEFQLELPIWEEMREIPILVVGQAALNENQLKDGTSVHGDSSQIMTRGLCLSEHDGSMSFRVPSQKFNDSTASFEACNHDGFMDFNLGPLKGNSNSEVMAILCLSGLPRDLTASVLAHEATHAWIKLHPDFKVRNSLPAQVEEGCAQLVAYLFLSDGLEAPRRHSGMGPSDEKLRQYFKFSIETDDNDIYGEGYRKAALAFSTIGIGALMNHVVHFQEFPQC